MLGFNTSAIRLKIVHSLAQASAATHFIETGTYHAATAICAHKCLCLKVWSCEASPINYAIAKMVSMGLHDVQVLRGDSRILLPKGVSELMRRDGVRPVFYLDAHGESGHGGSALLEELSVILSLNTFVTVIDDFAVPEREFIFGEYRNLQLRLDSIRKLLLSANIRRVFFPNYSPTLETGYGRAGYAIVLRSTALEDRIQEGSFPFSLLRGHDLA